MENYQGTLEVLMKQSIVNKLKKEKKKKVCTLFSFLKFTT